MEKQFPTHIVAVDGIVENDNNEILLVKHRHHGVYTIPGGQVEIGENLIEALIREIKEETGIDVKVEKLICVSSNTCTYQGYNGYGTIPTKVMFSFICKYLDGELCTSDETSESLWIAKDKVLDYITVPNLVERFKSYLVFQGEIQYLQYITKPEYDLKLKRFI